MLWLPSSRVLRNRKRQGAVRARQIAGVASPSASLAPANLEIAVIVPMLRREEREGSAVMRVQLIGVVAAAAMATSASAENAAVQACFDKMTNVEQKTCMRELHHAARAELEATYRTVLEAARTRDAGNVSQASAIEASQRTFEAYRNAECGNVVGGGTWGTGTATMVLGCYAEKDYERIRELKVPFDRR